MVYSLLSRSSVTKSVCPSCPPTLLACCRKVETLHDPKLRRRVMGG